MVDEGAAVHEDVGQEVEHIGPEAVSDGREDPAKVAPKLHVAVLAVAQKDEAEEEGDDEEDGDDPDRGRVAEQVDCLRAPCAGPAVLRVRIVEDAAELPDGGGERVGGGGDGLEKCSRGNN